jgi:hypothetical protein
MLKIIVFVGALLVSEEISPEIEDIPQDITYTCEDNSLSANINNEYIFDAMGYLEFDDTNDLMEPYISGEES